VPLRYRAGPRAAKVVATERDAVLQALSMRDPETVVREFCAAWNGRDVDAILAWFAADAVYHNMPIAPVRGHAEIRGVLEKFVPPASKIEFEILAVAVRGDVVFTERVDRFTVGGKEMALPVAGVFEVRDGKIAAWRDYFDMASYQRQLS
jgi:limonene-1,2-epoxide hydrolase